MCRFYALTGEEKYFVAAAKALELFDTTVNNGGVKTHFISQNSSILWYEEYPTQPYSLFVLNGFLYSMFGLYDFVNGCNRLNQASAQVAKKLFKNGLESLIKMLGLYDTGARSFYDLRHISNLAINPNVARWDYHMLHISQLSYMVNIIEQKQFAQLFGEMDREQISSFKTIIKRWDNYSKGIWNQNIQT